MAGDWIKMRLSLDTSWRVIAIAQQLGIPELHVVGCLWKLWCWADQHTIDGNAIHVTDVTLDRFTSVTGFADALRKVGWLEGRDNALSFPRFAEHNGQTAKNRCETNKRVAKHRNAKTVTDVTQKPLPEKRREEKSNTKKSLKKDSCPEVPQSEPSEPPVLVFPTVGNPSVWNLTQSKVDEYHETYPDLDVLAECRKAKQWTIDNPANRKTHGGMSKFLNGWMSRAQNSSRPSSALITHSRPSDGDPRGNIAVMNAVAAKLNFGDDSNG